MPTVMPKWQLQQAKNRLSELVRRAADEGPQVITLRGRDAAVVVAAEEFARLAAKPQDSLVDFFRSSPLADVSLDLARSRDAGRQVKL
jgi:prevent-host-death family protein